MSRIRRDTTTRRYKHAYIAYTALLKSLGKKRNEWSRAKLYHYISKSVYYEPKAARKAILDLLESKYTITKFDLIDFIEHGHWDMKIARGLVKLKGEFGL